jgi:DNA polymerase
VPGPQAARLDAVGDPASGIVVVVDMPEPEDRAAGALLSGEIGARFDRMLGMIGLDRTSLYILPFAPARPTTGKIGAGDQTMLRTLLDHHLTLIGPAKLLLLGDALAQCLFALPLARGRGATRMVRIGSKDVPAILSFPPRMVAPGAAAFRQQARDDLLAFQAL